ncbi:MAG: S46 family peptidase [Calditrichaeota bacterium]|nr:S46 family peptidase [Calditrichota bacterium]
MKRIVLFVVVLLLNLQFLRADEGMWLLNQLDQLNLKDKGLQMDVNDIYSPGKISLANAVVNLGGASAELVSAEGLILTNHHVAFGAVQRASTRGTDYLTNGFLAKTRDEELPAPGYVARILLEMKDVTDRVLKGIDGIDDPLKRQRAVKKRIEQIEEEIENGRSDIDADIASMYSGQKYILFKYQRFEDVRMVFIPPRSIGNYGGDIDNWMWPRHTGDFSFLRIYMSPDGKGAKYSPENIPFKPKRWIKIAREPLSEGDFTFIIGFPGRTNRYSTSYAVSFAQNYYYPLAVKEFGEIINLLDEIGKESPQLAIKAVGTSKWLNNGMKNYQGNLEGMKRLNLLGEKQKQEQELQKFINSDNDLKKKYGDLLAKFESEYRKSAQTFERRFLLERFNYLAGTIPGIARGIYGTASERAKPEDERNPSFSEKNVKRTIQRLKYRYMSYAPEIDKALLKRMLLRIKALPEDQRIKGLDYIFKDFASVDEFVDYAYANTKLTDVAYAQSLYEKSLDELNKSDDPFIKMARALQPETEKLNKEREERRAVLNELEKQYIEVLMAWKKRPFYPDANRTIRLTYGKVSGYSPRDAVWYEPFTTLHGVMEKETGKFPFIVPEKLKELYRTRDYGQWVDQNLGDVPVAFLNECDITGGNSGSPVFNAKGELVGIAFDGNWEALTGDWKFEPVIQRAINVDIRYVLFITEKFAGADYILKELGI